MNPAKIVIKLSAPPRDIALRRAGSAEFLRQQDEFAHYERGRLDGERNLAEQLVQQRAEVLEMQTSILAALKGTLPRVAQDCEQALVALAMEVARKLVADLPITAPMVESAIREARTQIEQATEHCVRLNPQDLELLQRVHSPLLLPAGSEEKVRFEASPQVNRGGCIIETDFGVIDGRREAKWANLQREVLNT